MVKLLQKISKDTDIKLNFYENTIDSLHFYLHHIFEAGLRLKKEDKEYKYDEKDQDDEMVSDSYYDGHFDKIKRILSERRNITKTFERFNSNKNTKFTINMTAVFLTVPNPALILIVDRVIVT